MYMYMYMYVASIQATGCFDVAVLEVYQFARDAAVAEAWLIAHEPYLRSGDFGVSVASLRASRRTSLSSRFHEVAVICGR